MKDGQLGKVNILWGSSITQEGESRGTWGDLGDG